VSAYRNIAIAISRRYLRGKSQFKSNVQEGTGEAAPPYDPDNKGRMDEDEFIGHIADLQATHSSHVAGMMYGRTIIEPTNSTTHRRQRFRQSSQD
jgi:hypothetical protein